MAGLADARAPVRSSRWRGPQPATTSGPTTRRWC